MKRPTAVAVLWSLFVTSAVAKEPVDNKVKAAIYEIDRAEKQMAGATAGQASKLKRIVRMIEGADAQLQSSQNQEHESWLSARARLDALIARMQELEKPEPVNPSAASRLSAADLSLLGTIDRQTDGFIRQLSEYDLFDYTRLQDNLAHTLDGLKKQYQGLSNPSHPQAIAVAQKILSVEKQIGDQIATLAAQENSLGNVESEVARIRQRMNPDNRPWHGSPLPNAPYGDGVVAAFAQQMNTWKGQAQRDLDYLQGIEGKTARVDVRDLMQDVRRELSSIDQYNEGMADNIERQLVGTDHIDTYLEIVPANRVEDEVTKLQCGLGLLEMATAFDEAVGRQPKATVEREQRYNNAIVTLNAKADAARAAAKSSPSTASTGSKGKKRSRPARKKMAPQRIELYGSRIIELTADGEVWIDGDKAGDITSDGEIWVAGDKEGDLTEDGEVWKTGDKIGDITSDGEVWRDSNLVGNVESDGTIWINSSREGWFEGGSPSHAAVIVFYGFFDL